MGFLAVTLTETELLLVRRLREAEGADEVLVVSHGHGGDAMAEIEAIINPINLCGLSLVVGLVLLSSTKQGLCLFKVALSSIPFEEEALDRNNETVGSAHLLFRIQPYSAFFDGNLYQMGQV